MGANAFENSLVAKKDFRMETPASKSSKHILILKRIIFLFLYLL